MGRKDWTVRILKKYRRSLSKRFNPRNAKKSKVVVGCMIIGEPCPLCEYYQNVYTEGCKKECPFAKFGYKGRREYMVGCFVWINHVVYDFMRPFYRFIPHYIMWNKSYNTVAVNHLNQLRKETKKLITWV